MPLIHLPTGHLDIQVEDAAWPLDTLCDFAARENPKRGFLVVSRVLGRHLPAAPQTMRRSVQDLATRLPQDLPGPIMVVGLAETAVCLGQTVHEELRRTRDDAYFIHSTRQILGATHNPPPSGGGVRRSLTEGVRHERRACGGPPPSPSAPQCEVDHAPGMILDCRGQSNLALPEGGGSIISPPLLCRFEEPHSHASAHLIYRPNSLPAPRSLVIVDDEISTGTTIRNLATALTTAWPQVEQIAVATLTDWSAGRDWLAHMPRPTRVAALLRGRLDWTQGQTITETKAFDTAAASLGRLSHPRNFGRLGIAEPIDTPPNTLPPIPARLRIVGTGEFTYLPFRLAESLAAEGHDVVVQATSRSPARIGAAMRTKLTFDDNYGTHVPNYLYNADPANGRTTWIAHETGAASIDPALVAALGATLIGWDA